MENKEHTIELTSAEISSLWTTFQEVTLAICGIDYFLTHVEDEEIYQVLEQASLSAKARKEKAIQFFVEENYPIPQGFTEQDVNLSAPRLFSDKLYLAFILNNMELNILTYGLSLINAVRTDIIDFYLGNLNETQQLYKIAIEVSKEKGFCIRAPHIPKSKQVSFVKKESFLAGWIGERRPLLGPEITNLVYNAKRNALGQAVITGFSQVANDKEVRHYFERGREISGKHLKVFTSILHENYLPDGALLMTSEVTDSKMAPFSDKLMMTLVTTLNASTIGEYGTSISTSPRRDLSVQYTKLMAEIGTYSDDGAEILINNGWMEQPPMAANRKGLAK